ncbi:unnamed protein product [Diplocarpon coronariae]|nr:phosphorylcholine phosphatase [Diplocarpon mali]
MKCTISITAALLAVVALAASSSSDQTPLESSAAETRKAINDMLANHRKKSHSRKLAARDDNLVSGSYGVFDADQTIWKNDLTEAAIPYLENKGVISRDKLDDSLKLIAFKDNANYTETLYSYYRRLCTIDNNVCYAWAAQVFSGLILRDLKVYVDEIFDLKEDIPTSYWKGEIIVPKRVEPPKIYPFMTVTLKDLRRDHIETYIVTASNEELVRMVVSDPKYGYDIKPENVIGVSVLMKNSETGELTTSRKQIAAGYYNQTANLDLQLTSYLWSPTTWYAGKLAAMKTYIDAWGKPMIAAGDTPGSDTYMLFDVDVAQGGLRLWVKKSESEYIELQRLIAKGISRQLRNSVPVTADSGWRLLRPEILMTGQEEERNLFRASISNN